MTIKLVKMSIRNVFSFLELTILLSSVFVLQWSSAVAHKSYSPDFIDVTILDVNASINETYRGATIHVFVTVEATWDVIDFSSFWVAAFYNVSLIDMETIFVLYSGHEIFTFNFTWNTSGVEIGSYIISAMTSTSIMPYIDGRVQILPVGNINTKQGYSTIQEAINNATKGDTIFASSGTYYEHIVVNRTVSLIGENKETTIIDGGLTDPGEIIFVAEDNVKIHNFTVQNTRVGGSAIWVDGYVNSTICDNIIVTNNGDGIRILHSSGNMISDNIVTNNPYTSIGFNWAHDNIVHNNTIVNNLIGVGGGYTTYNNTFSENVIMNNTYGFLIAFEDSKIFHNNFINNTVQASFDGLIYTNVWDDGCEGNYWSDYNGTDSDGDGIGDAPYVIEGNNADNYPLMNPYWLPGDVNHDLKIDIYDVVRITGVYNSQQGDPNWNCHSDIAEPYGIINIYDVVTCTKDYKKEYTP